MEQDKLIKMSTNVPNVVRRVNLASMPTAAGSRLRGAFFMLVASPFFLAADQNGGLLNFGFLPGH
jgi:hypothetical protein